VLLCWLGALALAGCASDPTQGYAIGTGSSFSRDVRTVHVPIFQNPTYAKGLEFELTDAVIKEIQRTTPWKVSSASAADTVLEGSITDADLRKLSTQRDSGVVQEQAVGLTVSFAFRDTRSGKTLVGRDRFSASEVFVPANPVKERLEVGENAVIQRMARDIVAELRSSW
jgi:hypothetical protein